MNLNNLFILIFMPIIFLGCYSSSKQVSTAGASYNVDIVSASYDIVNKLENNLRQPISQDAPIVVASFVDVSDLTKSSAFGRIMAEQVGSRLAQKGYKVVEIKLRHSSIFVDPENKGEFLLSRNIKEISAVHKASVVVVGTYAYAPGYDRYDNIYVSARMVNPVDSIVISSCDKKIHLEYRETRHLIQ